MALQAVTLLLYCRLSQAFCFKTAASTASTVAGFFNMNYVQELFVWPCPAQLGFKMFHNHLMVVLRVCKKLNYSMRLDRQQAITWI